MELNIKNAAKLFFPNPSFEMIFFEAVKNSIDANATKIEIAIELNSFSDHKSLQIKLTDNGDGFTERNYEKFKTLLEVESEDHKGLGRLVFLNYFNKVTIQSDFINEKEETQNREFLFDENFKGKSKLKDFVGNEKSTVLHFTEFKLAKIYQYDHVKAVSIKEELLAHFYPLFYRLKVEQKDLKIKIVVKVKTPNPDQDFYSDTQIIDVLNLPELKKVPLDASLDLLSQFEVLYSIKKLSNEYQKSSVTTTICVDERTVKVEILSKSGIPEGYDAIFILYSNFFTGKVDTSRQNLTLDSITLSSAKKLFSEKVAEILNAEIPTLKEKNESITTELEEKFPHLQGLFDNLSVGIMDKTQSLDTAQERFFKAQKEILNATSLTDEQYHKSLGISSRLLTEYVLYRNIIIKKLKSIDQNNKEKEIHDIIVPTKSKFLKNTLMENLYTNNAWVLDDKYMSYASIFSELEIGQLISFITSEDNQDDSLRPDIAIVFSADPNLNSKVDVVIIELKKLGLKDYGEKNNIYVQLLQRATKLLQYYPNKIQRIWFYGVIDIDPAFKLLLENQGFTELYSNGTVMYRHSDIKLENGDKVPTGFFIQSYEALLEDAYTRNETFLSVLKEGFKRND